MAHLSSCYFCGTALDEPLGTYGVGEGRTVTLCPTCREKLGKLLGTAGDSIPRVDDPEPAPVAVPDGQPDGDSGADTAVAADRQEADEAETTPAQPATDGVDDAAATPGADRATGLDEELAEAMETDLLPAEDDDAPESGTAAAAESDDSDPPEMGLSDADDEGAGETAERGTEAAGSGDTRSDSGAGGNGESPEVSLSALEYNKVMRLLQNREFPVDRAEIETVATNAYDLSQPDCKAVIDLAIDRGLFEEADGQLSRPE